MIKDYGMLHSIDSYNVAVTILKDYVIHMDDINDWIILSKIGLLVIGYDVVGVDDYE